MVQFIFRYIASLLFIAQHYTCVGQPAVIKELRNADSLMHIEHIEEADSLLKEIEKLPHLSKIGQLKLQYFREYFYNATEENTLATKDLLQLPEMAERENQVSTKLMKLIRTHAATALSIEEKYRKYHLEHPGRHSKHLIETIIV
jgi:hypothetical protein